MLMLTPILKHSMEPPSKFTYLVSGLWTLFDGKWSHRNDHLHNDENNVIVASLDAKIRKLYRNPAAFVRASQMFLFDSLTEDDCINLPPHTKEVWVKTALLAVKTKHGNLRCLEHTTPPITTYFTRA